MNHRRLQKRERRYSSSLFLFFFQAEDGIRDIGVTGVQTCALPILAIDEREIDYLIAAINRYFRQQLRREDIVHSFSGVRPLFDDGQGNPSAVTRDYVFEVADEGGRAPLLSAFGGKITTYRKLAEHALEKLKPYFPQMRSAWTAGAPLPGGDMPDADFDTFLAEVGRRHPWLPQPLAYHYARLYGTR